MNTRMLLAGLAIGFILTFGLLRIGDLTGYVVAVGEQELELGMEISESQLVALDVPEELEALAVQATYEGNGYMDITLVGNEERWHVASYEAPKVVRNTTFLLEKGGTVARIPDEGLLTYERNFNGVCGETCNATMQGPYHLQISISGGTLNLESVTYDPAATFTREIEPEDEPELEEVVPELPARENLAPDCAENTCSEGLMCHVGYCIAETGHLNITNSQGELIALFDKNGRVLLRGEFIQASAELPPQNAFIVQNAEETIAWIDENGDFYIVGTAHEEVVNVPTVEGEHFVIHDGERPVSAVLGTTGDFFTIDRLAENALP